MSCSYGAPYMIRKGCAILGLQAPSFVKNQIFHSFKACDYFFAVQEKQRCIFVLRKVFERRSDVNTDFSQGQDNTKAKTASRETLRIHNLTHTNKELFLHQDLRKANKNCKV